MRRLVHFLLAIAGLWLLVGALAYLFQRRLLYFPDSEAVERPRGRQYEGLEDVVLEAEDGIPLCAWHWPGTRETTLLFLHGNAGHRGHRLDWIERFHRRGWGVFIVDYRGYGGSGGSPTEEGLYRDAAAAAS